MMKTNIINFTLLLSIVFFAFGSTMTMKLTKEEIQNIIDTDQIVIKPKIEERLAITTLNFYTKDNIFLGESEYLSEKSDALSLYLINLKIDKNYRNSGLGEQIFYKTMYHIHKNYQQALSVIWEIDPFDTKEAIASKEEFKTLYKFYHRVGATVDEDSNKGKINLKEAGYFDEN